MYRKKQEKEERERKKKKAFQLSNISKLKSEMFA
jgi:hypothetical protein